MGKLYYFQAPSLVINPESSAAPKLGSIFATLDTLMAPLNQFDYVGPPTSLLNVCTNDGFRETASSSFKSSAGLQATTAYGSVGGSGDLVYAFARDKEYMYNCERLNTTEFTPTAEFVAESIHASQRVQHYLDNAFVGRKRVYMVTGLKIATGFSTSLARTTQHNPKLKISVDATPVGVPVQGGPELDVTVAGSRTVVHGRTANPIVFAYRVIRVKMRWDGEARYKYKSGGKYGMDDSEDSDEDSDDDDDDGGVNVEKKKEDQWELEPLDEKDIATEFPDAVRIDVEEGETKEGLTASRN